MHVFNGSTYVSIPYNSNHDEYSLSLFGETSFIFGLRNIQQGEYSIVQGGHGLTCPADCENPELEIPEEDARSYLKTSSITSRAVISQRNTLYRSREQILLLPGFTVQDGAQFSAKTETCNDPAFLTDGQSSDEKQIAPEHVIPADNFSGSAPDPARPSLGQNVPNPFSGTTQIDYHIPNGYRTAQIKIFNLLGFPVQEYDISAPGTGHIAVRMDGLSRGIYYYALILDGSVAASAKMTFAR